MKKRRIQHAIIISLLLPLLYFSFSIPIQAIPPTVSMSLVLNDLEDMTGILVSSNKTAETSTSADDLLKQIKLTHDRLMREVTAPEIGYVGGEWAIIGLCRSEFSIPADYLKGYSERVGEFLKDAKGVLSSVKYTEYSRLILAMTAAGFDVSDVGGYNLLEYLSYYNNVIKQGINGPIYALLALDSHNYLASEANLNSLTELKLSSGVPCRQMYIDYILSKECSDSSGVAGGFALSGNVPQTDITAMALQALAKYKENPEVAAALSRGIIALKKAEENSGAEFLWNQSSPESAAQTVVAKSSLGLDPTPDVNNLLKYAVQDGGFSHELGSGFDLMATEQAYYALVAYYRFLTGKNALYDMTDVSISSSKAGYEFRPGVMPDPGITVLLKGNKLAFDQPPLIENGRVLVPMRRIFEAFGAEVDWDPATTTATATTQDHVIRFTIGASSATVNGRTLDLDVPATVISGRTMIPLRFLSENLGFIVSWYGGNHVVTIG